MSSIEPTPRIRRCKPISSINGWKSATHSCSERAITERSSAAPEDSFSRASSSESGERVVWTWKSPQRTPGVSTTLRSVTGTRVLIPAVTVTMVSERS